MKTYRNLSYTLFVLSVLSFGFVLFTSAEELGKVHTALYNVSVSVFSVAIVVLIVAVFLYFQSRNLEITILRRRTSKVYSELLQHKMKVIEVMDEYIPMSDWENFLYSDNEFPRIKKFLYEEYFLLFKYEPFIKSKEVDRIHAIYDLHKELENFMRSIVYDNYELIKFRKEYLKEYGRDIIPSTHEDEFTDPGRPQLAEAYEALLQGNEYALQNIDKLLKLIDIYMRDLDACKVRGGIPWSETKPGFDDEFKMWMSAQP